jgi:Protein of unknown function (DUF3606)
MDEVKDGDLKKKGSQGRSKINMHEEHKVKYWTHQLGVSKTNFKRRWIRSATALRLSAKN